MLQEKGGGGIPRPQWWYVPAICDYTRTSVSWAVKLKSIDTIKLKSLQNIQYFWLHCKWSIKFYIIIRITWWFCVYFILCIHLFIQVCDVYLYIIYYVYMYPYILGVPGSILPSRGSVLLYDRCICLISNSRQNIN